MTTPEEVAAYADQLLESSSCPDYPNALNGLQITGRGPIQAIAAAVDFSTRTIEKAIEAGANFLVVHHGMFWPGLERITGITYRRICSLIENDLAVYSSHLPLDRHESLGNNALLAREIGLEASGSFAHHDDVTIGVSGSTDVMTVDLVRRVRKFAQTHGGDVRTTAIADRQRTHRWAICTGAGASAETLREAVTMEIDTLIVGEGAHWTAVSAEEHGLTILYAGHYATETLGVQALARHLSEKFKLPWSFIEAPTGL
ncbi:MAG TPA: Nif3-like dinuclear metal center hexameric protein [Gemmatimonadaceae bacterium]|nr:Nif3-like dinuclear metal center hexameric protein [Gemmatimonadaceae bacterium]